MGQRVWSHCNVCKSPQTCPIYPRSVLLYAGTRGRRGIALVYIGTSPKCSFASRGIFLGDLVACYVVLGVYSILEGGGGVFRRSFHNVPRGSRSVLKICNVLTGFYCLFWRSVQRVLPWSSLMTSMLFSCSCNGFWGPGITFRWSGCLWVIAVCSQGCTTPFLSLMLFGGSYTVSQNSCYLLESLQLVSEVLAMCV